MVSESEFPDIPLVKSIRQLSGHADIPVWKGLGRNGIFIIVIPQHCLDIVPVIEHPVIVDESIGHNVSPLV